MELTDPTSHKLGCFYKHIRFIIHFCDKQIRILIAANIVNNIDY